MNRILEMSGIALAALFATLPLSATQLGDGSSGGGGITAQGGPAAPASGPGGLPGGAPGVQRAPLNAEPGANEGAGHPAPPGGDIAFPRVAPDGSGGSTGTAMSDDAIWRACMMKANPDECRTRLRGGVPDDSIERNPP